MPQPYDTSFTRDGRTLAEWLPELVSPDLSLRRRAGDVVHAMMYGVPSVHTDHEELAGPPPGNDHQDAWKRAICEAVASPGFPAREFVAATVDRMITLHDARMEQFHRNMATDNFEDRAEDADDELSIHHLALLMVFDALNHALLAPPGALERLLAHKHFWRQAVQAIARIGPPARERFEQQVLKLAEESPWSEALAALSSVQRDDPVLLNRALGWIDKAMRTAAANPQATITDEEADGFHDQFYEGDRAWHAAHLLVSIGNALPTTTLMQLMDLSRSVRPGHRAAAAMVLGHVACGRNDFDMRQIIARLMELTHDQSWVAGRAIDSLGLLRADAARVVPRLIELFDTFEEFNPDEGYGGAHARVCRALEQFGPSAAAAVPRLDQELQAGDDEFAYPQDVLRVLVAIGAAAASAIPTLQRIHDQLVQTGGYDDSIREIQAAIDRINAK